MGVKQEEVMSPQLCTLFLSDLLEVIKNAKLGIPCGNEMVSLLLYADNIVIFAENPENMQCLLNILSSWCSKWCMCVNLRKKKIVHF